MICYAKSVVTAYHNLKKATDTTIDANASGVSTTRKLSTALAIISSAYLILLIICFAMAIRFRKNGGGKAIIGLTVSNFIIGIIVIVIALIMEICVAVLGLSLSITGTIITIGTGGWKTFYTCMKIASWFMYIPVVLFAICIILSSITTIVGWVSLRKKKVVSA